MIDLSLGLGVGLGGAVLTSFLLRPARFMNIYPGLRFGQAMWQLTRSVTGGMVRGGGGAALEWFHQSAAGQAYFDRVTRPRQLAALDKKIQAQRYPPAAPKTGAERAAMVARGGGIYVAAAASGAILGAAIGIGVSKALWGESGEQTAREFYGGSAMTIMEEGWRAPFIISKDYWETVSTIPDNIFHD